MRTNYQWKGKKVYLESLNADGLECGVKLGQIHCRLGLFIFSPRTRYFIFPRRKVENNRSSELILVILSIEE
jgi:hypothetical protein